MGGGGKKRKLKVRSGQKEGPERWRRGKEKGFLVKVEGGRKNVSVCRAPHGNSGRVEEGLWLEASEKGVSQQQKPTWRKEGGCESG